MDKIIIKDLEVYGYHGVASEEKALGQRFIVSVEAWLDLKQAGYSDNIDDTVHYGQMCDDIEAVVVERSYGLIESLAEALARRLLDKYTKIEAVKITVKKPWAPIAKSFKYVAVEIERKRYAG